MGQLTEQEIFSCMQDNLRSAVDHCVKLASVPLTGPSYDAFRKNLKLVEGACRQAAAWRSDSRWYDIGLQVARAHKMAGNWLRGAKQPDGTKIALSPKQRFDLFQKLAANLRQLYALCEQTRTAKTGVIGPILPTPQRLFRENRPVAVSRPSGLIVPAKYAGAA